MDDLISRHEVLDYIDKMPSELNQYGHRMIRRIRLTEYISDTLPSVQQAQKVGKLLDSGSGVECSECGEWYSHGYLSKSVIKYCSNCGCRITEEGGTE